MRCVFVSLAVLLTPFLSHAADVSITLEPQLYDVKEGTADYTWHRPPEVNYVLISACGGGGGGGMAFWEGEDYKKTRSQGLGGEASQSLTILLPVDQDKYQIHVGAGGARTVPGQATSFSGGSINLIVLGGATGTNKTGAGSAGPFGGGGMGNDNWAVAEANADATAKCSGGGGEGVMVKRSGGKGGNGYLLLYPMPDIARFARALALIENIPPSPLPSPDDKVAKPEETPKAGNGG